MQVKPESIAASTLDWYRENKRDLPFRRTKNPYKIWVSEVMSQQTQLDRIIPYYERFLEQLPTIQDLANAEEDLLLKLWEGLGYYSRVRNMQKAAQYVVNECGGEFPRTYKEIIKMSGIGPYIAGAVAGICFNERVSAVDGNVLRLFTRVFEIHDDIREQKTMKQIQALAEASVQSGDVGEINQSYIEIGALICTPRNPKCLECPLQRICISNKHQTVGAIPYKSPAKKQKQYEYVACIVRDNNGDIFVEQREMLLLNKQWQFPMIEKPQEIRTITQMIEEKIGSSVELYHVGDRVKHVFSHQVWDVEPYYFTTSKPLQTQYVLNEQTQLITAHKKLKIDI